MTRTLLAPAPPLASAALVVLGAWMLYSLGHPLGLILGGPCFLTGAGLLIHQGRLQSSSLARAQSDLEREKRSLLDHGQKEDRLRQGLLVQLREGVILLDSAKAVRLFNPAAQVLLGSSSRLAAGGSLHGLFREPETLRQIERAYGGEVAEWSLHLEPRILRLRAVPFDPDEGERNVLLTLDDITHQEALETTRQKFISNASHELKTPVTSIRIAAENLLDGGDVAAAGVDNIKAILRSVDRMTMLLNDISELSRIETGALRLALIPVQIGAFVPQLLEDLKPQAAPRKIKLKAELEAGVERMVIEADSLRLHQLLENLLSNAIKFSPQSSEVILRVLRREQWIHWTVQDSGPGISESDVKRIFERFFRAASARGIPGTGLGLAIVKHLVLLMGGEVSVQSEPGKGSAFTVKLPIQ